MDSSGWNTIESDAGVFTSLVENLGVKGVQFEEILTLDPSELSTLQPLHGVIFLFKYPSSSQGSYAPSTPVDGSFDHAAAQELFFATQTIHNACATQAILGVVLNRARIDADVELGAELSDFAEFAMALPPDMRGDALGNSQLIREVHNGFARSSPFVDERRHEADDEENAAFHFVAYTAAGNTLWELDGLQPAPISHGVCDQDSFPEKVVDVIRRRVARYDQAEIRFNLLAVCRDLRIRAMEFGDDQLAQVEADRRRAWAFENALRRHNFVSFAGELLHQVVADLLDKGGEPAFQKWIDEGRERSRARQSAHNERKLQQKK